MIINLGDQPINTNLEILGHPLPFTGKTWVLDKEHNAEQGKDFIFSQSSAIDVPGQSITLFVSNK